MWTTTMQTICKGLLTLNPSYPHALVRLASFWYYYYMSLPSTLFWIWIFFSLWLHMPDYAGCPKYLNFCLGSFLADPKDGGDGSCLKKNLETSFFGLYLLLHAFNGSILKTGSLVVRCVCDERYVNTTATLQIGKYSEMRQRKWEEHHGLGPQAIAGMSVWFTEFLLAAHFLTIAGLIWQVNLYFFRQVQF